MDLIDTHQHLIYRNEATYSWAKDIPVLSQSDFTVKDYQKLTNDFNIIGTLFMECAVDDPDYKNESNQELVGETPIVSETNGFPQEDMINMSANNFSIIYRKVP